MLTDRHERLKYVLDDFEFDRAAGHVRIERSWPRHVGIDEIAALFGLGVSNRSKRQAGHKREKRRQYHTAKDRIHRFLLRDSGGPQRYSAALLQAYKPPARARNATPCVALSGAVFLRRRCQRP